MPTWKEEKNSAFAGMSKTISNYFKSIGQNQLAYKYDTKSKELYKAVQQSQETTKYKPKTLQAVLSSSKSKNTNYIVIAIAIIFIIGFIFYKRK
jgi:hypothetical protein